MLEDNSQQSQQSAPQGAAPAAAPAPELAAAPAPVEPPSASELMQSIIAEHRAVAQQQQQQPAAPAPETNQPADQGDAYERMSQAERDFAMLADSDPQLAGDLTAAAFNQASPEFYEANRDYLLYRLGL